MSAVSKDYAALAASTSTLLESSMMEGDELYDPTTVPIANEEWSKKGGTSNLCRLCANTSDYFIPIFEGEGLEHELSEKIDKHLPIKVCDSDSLPIHVCYQCASTLIAWHDLLLNCVEAEKKLLQIQQQVEQDDLEESKNIEFDAAPSMDSDNAEDSVEATTPLVTPEEMEKSAPSTSKKNTSIKERPSLKRPLAKKSASSQKKARKTETEISPVGPEDGPAEEETVIGRLKEEPRFGECVFNPCSNLQEHGETKFIVETICTQNISSPRRDDELATQSVVKLSKTRRKKIIPQSCDSMKVYSPRLDRQRHTCNTCGRSYMTRKSLKEHIKKHSQEPVKCDLCGRMYKNEHVLKTHISLHTGAQPRPCSHCDKAFFFASSLKQHMKQEHGEFLLFKCDVCGKTFNLKCHLKSHNETHNHDKIAPILHICQMCGKTFKKLQSLKIHEKQIHLGVPKQHICECCGAMFHNISKLKLHMLRHTGDRPFTCEACGLRFGTKHRLNNHLVCHSEERPHTCGVCGKTFKRQRNLGMHEQNSHGIFSQGMGKEKVVISFPCQVCDKQFTTKHKLAAHMRNHTGERPFTCETCGREYKTAAGLGFHTKTSHMVWEGKPMSKYIQDAIKKDFPCKICGKVLSSRVGREHHIRTHTGERPYKCKLCELALKTPAQLHAHMQIHSDSKPFPCTYCDKTFRRRPHLVSHLRTHTGEKPYSCDVCGRAFSQKGDMKKHREKIHNMPGMVEKISLVSL